MPTPHLRLASKTLVEPLAAQTTTPLAAVSLVKTSQRPVAYSDLLQLLQQRAPLVASSAAVQPTLERVVDLAAGVASVHRQTPVEASLVTTTTTKRSLPVASLAARRPLRHLSVVAPPRPILAVLLVSLTLVEDFSVRTMHRPQLLPLVRTTRQPIPVVVSLETLVEALDRTTRLRHKLSLPRVACLAVSDKTTSKTSRSRRVDSSVEAQARRTRAVVFLASKTTPHSSPAAYLAAQLRTTMLAVVSSETSLLHQLEVACLVAVLATLVLLLVVYSVAVWVPRTTSRTPEAACSADRATNRSLAVSSEVPLRTTTLAARSSVCLRTTTNPTSVDPCSLARTTSNRTSSPITIACSVRPVALC